MSLNSHLIYGHVGAQATILPLQLNGFDVWHMPTVIYSNHPGHGRFCGRVIAQADFTPMLEELRQGSLLRAVSALHSGFIGTDEQARAWADFCTQTWPNVAERPLYCCDPVLGDNGNLYVPKAVAQAVRDDLLPLCDVIIPNRFELAWLAEQSVTTLATAVHAAATLRRHQLHRHQLHRHQLQWADESPIVICTSAEESDGHVGTLFVGPDDCFVVRCRKHPHAPNGTGDLFTSAFMAAWLNGQGPVAAVSEAVIRVWLMVEATEDTAKDLALVRHCELLTGAISDTLRQDMDLSIEHLD